MWEHFAHQADIGIRATADSLSSAFEDAAIALTAIVTKPKKVEAKESVNIDCSGKNEELLFVNWLNAVIYEMVVRKMLFSKFDVSIENLKLSAKIWGEKINQEKHSPAVEPKAVTYNQLSVTEENGKWLAQCVVDV
ncbi:MAG: archease [Phycisphaerae bacterium]|jgi:tRNA nucleotidyltransferase (CCA-adding enzyme)